MFEGLKCRVDRLGQAYQNGRREANIEHRHDGDIFFMSDASINAVVEEERELKGQIPRPRGVFESLAFGLGQGLADRNYDRKYSAA